MAHIDPHHILAARPDPYTLNLLLREQGAKKEGVLRQELAHAKAYLAHSAVDDKVPLPQPSTLNPKL